LKINRHKTILPLLKSNPVLSEVETKPTSIATLLTKRPNKHVGIIFDWLVFGISTLLGFLFSSFTINSVSPAMPWIVLAMVACYAVAVALKRVPFSFRLSKISKTVELKRMNSDMFIFQFLFHCIAFWVLVYVVLSQIVTSRTVTWWDADNQAPPFLIGLAVGITLTVMVFKLRAHLHNKSGQPVSIKKNLSVRDTESQKENHIQRQEFSADLLLVIAVSFFTSYLWNPLVGICISNSDLSTNKGVIQFVFMISLLYMCVYLPFRLIYLVEEGGYSKRQWLSFLFLLMMIMIRSVIYVYYNDW
jgi:hypothetical protein